MTTMSWSRILIAGLTMCTALSSASCVSSRGYRQGLDDRDAEIRKLREERTALKGQIQDLKASLDSAHGQIADASATRAPEPETAKFPELDSLGIGYGMRDGNMVISIPASITFSSGQATLEKAGKQALDKVASTLKSQYPDAKYAIEGHTDSDPIKHSKFASNRQLSVERALAVLSFLVTECGIKDEQCIVAGHGEYVPIAPNQGKDDKARNRRVEIVVHRR